MPRTNEGDVLLAIDTELASDVLAGYIADASVWVDMHLAGQGISDALLEVIEKYLACHFITLRDPRLKAAKFGDTSETYQRDGEVTEYLKAAMALDPTGIIADLFTPSKPRFRFRVGQGYA